MTSLPFYVLDTSQSLALAPSTEQEDRSNIIPNDTRNIPCKLRIAAPSKTTATTPLSSNRNVTGSVKRNTKKEPLLASGLAPTTSDASASNALVFQSLQFTDIASSVKPEPFFAKQEPKTEPRLSKLNSRRASQPEIILEDNEPVVKKEEPLITSSSRNSENEVIVLDSDEETAVTQPIVLASNAVRGGREQSDDSETVIVRRRRRSNSKPPSGEGQTRIDIPPAESGHPQEEANQMKASLGNFLRVISSSARGEGSFTSLLHTAQQTYESAKRNQVKVKLRNSYPVGPPQSCDGDEHFKSVAGPSDGYAVRNENDSQRLTEGTEPEKRDISTKPAFERDLPDAWFRYSSRDGEERKEFLDDAPQLVSRLESEREAEEHGEYTQGTILTCKDEDEIMSSEVKSENDGTAGTDAHSRDVVAPCPAPLIDVEGLHASQMEARRIDQGAQAVPCRHDTVVKEELSVECVDTRSVCATKRRRREVWRKYWRVDPERNICGKRKHPEREESPHNVNREDRTENRVDRSQISKRVGEESDVDPAELELNPRPRQRRTSDILHGRDRERDVRAQRRAAEAEGGDVHWSLMVDRKPVVEEQRNNVIIKVRESRGKMQYSFVKPRNERLRDLRVELELVAKLPPDMKFELEYKKRVIKDRDTPESLGMLYTARVRAKRRARPDDDSSDSITVVERKKQRENLLQVTVQDENGKKHTFHHDKNTKLSSLFHAFAKLSQNDIRSYRFFFEGRRLTHDDRPVDCEDFQDGALIDAFFETTGGDVVMMSDGRSTWYPRLLEILCVSNDSLISRRQLCIL